MIQGKTIQLKEDIMRDENEIKIAWDIWNLMVRLSVLIWDRYEEEFRTMVANKDKRKENTKQMDHDKMNPSD